MNDSSPFTLCNVAQDQMPEVQVVAHLLAIALGVVIKGFFFPGNSGFECPPCVLTCGNVSCPSRSCTTGHIEIGNFSLLVLTGLVIVLGLIVVEPTSESGEQGHRQWSSGHCGWPPRPWPLIPVEA